MNEIAHRVSRHEAAHAAAAFLLGWPVTGVSRSPTWDGSTHLDPRTDGDIRERAEELGIILLCGVLREPEGGGEDLAKLSELVSAGTHLSAVWDRAHALTETTRFRQLARAVEDALLHRTTLTAAALRKLMLAA